MISPVSGSTGLLHIHCVPLAFWRHYFQSVKQLGRDPLIPSRNIDLIKQIQIHFRRLFICMCYSLRGSQNFPCKEDLVSRFVAKSYSTRILTGRTCRGTVGFSRMIKDLYSTQPNCTGQSPPLKRIRAIRIYKETYGILGGCELKQGPLSVENCHVSDTCIQTA